MPYPTYEERVAFRKLPEEKRKELWDKMTPQERSDISGYGAEDDPGYCDINGRCFDNDEDAEYVDSWIKENEKLKEEVNYWKNFALVYWSGNQLGNLALAESCDSVVWNEALEECNSNDDYDREALTKKCLQKN